MSAAASDLRLQIGALSESGLVALTDLAGLASANPWRLRRLLWHHPAVEAWQLLCTGARLHDDVERALAPQVLRALRAQAAAASPGAVLERCDRLDLAALALTDPRYPEPLRDDAQAPVVLFAAGDPAAADARRVSIVGTRNATAAGRTTAAELGRTLAAAGVAVVSGLARGIDGAAHRGVRQADGPGRPIGVVANGLDQPYPRQHTDLWRWVAEAGLLVSEWAPGFGPERWRFPLRNRMLAALGELLIVVESRERGGSLITVDQAEARQIPVFAVPGSVRSPKAAGPNGLIGAGAHSLLRADDALVALGLRGDARAGAPLRAQPSDPLEVRLLDLCRARSCTLDMVVVGLECSPAEAALAAIRLSRAGWIEEVGGWFEPTGSRLLAP